MWNRAGNKVKNVNSNELAIYITEEIDPEKSKQFGLIEVLYTKRENKSQSVIMSKSETKQKKKTFEEIWKNHLKVPTEAQISTMIGLIIENIIFLTWHENSFIPVYQ